MLRCGGEGGPHFKGKTHSDETKEKISKNEKGRIKHRETLKRKFSSGELTPWNKGVRNNISDEYRKKMSEAAKNRAKSPCFICEREMDNCHIKMHMSRHNDTRLYTN